MKRGSYVAVLVLCAVLAIGLHAASVVAAEPRLAGNAIPSKPAAKLPEKANSIGMVLVTLPAGEFLMGSGDSAADLVQLFAADKRKPEDFADELPRHRVRISHPFRLGKHEVTLGQFKAFVAETGYQTEAETDGQGGWGYNAETKRCEGRAPRWTWRDPGYAQTDTHPVVNVSWNDAVAFCKWLARKENKNYRLPTEAEWEYACRAGAQTRYSMTDDPQALPNAARTYHPEKQSFGHVQELRIEKDDADAFPVPVGRYAPNAFGLHDMHGNVWEWCADWHADEYYAQSPFADPRGPGEGRLKVRRGGAWNSFPIWARASFRNWNMPDSRCVNLGFRVACDADERDAPPSKRVSILFTGDVMLDNDPGHFVRYGGDPFEHVAAVLRDADIAVCNLECVLGRGGTRVDKPFSFRAAAGSVDVLKRYFTAVSLANNHTGDFGPKAFTASLDMLEKAKLDYFGGGRDRRAARAPLILERHGLRVALLGYNDFPPKSFAATEKHAGSAWLDEAAVLEDIKAARARRHADIVIPFLHWGSELVAGPDEEQKNLARRMIDAGASAVVGSHPHVTQTVDLYRGKPIIYSLGNFVFDYYPCDPEQWTGWIVRLTFDAAGAVDLETHAVELDKTGIPHLAPEPRRNPDRPRR